MAEAELTEVFDAAFLRRLENLHLQVRKVLSGSLRAERRSRKTGSSLEFADYRNYAPGDDLRRVDWSIYARIDRLMTKLYEEEEDLEVAILLDASTSMRWQADSQKWTLARELAASLAYLGLTGLDRVGLWVFDSALRAESGIFRGRSDFHSVIRFLRNYRPDARTATDLGESLTRFARMKRRPGLAIVLTDCLDPAGYERGFSSILGRHFALHVIQLMDPAEAALGETGDLKLRDSETGEEIAVTASPALLRAYAAEVERFRDGVKTWCQRAGAGYSFIDTRQTFEDVVLRLFRRDGLLR